MQIEQDNIDREITASESISHDTVMSYLKDSSADVVAAATYNPNLVLQDVSATTLRVALITLNKNRRTTIGKMASQKLKHELNQRNVVWQ